MDLFRITDTRSRHEDTDYVSISLAVGSAPPMTKTKAMGNLNNGTFKPGLTFDNISVASNVPVVFTYAIVNNGHSSQADVEKSLEKAGTQLAQKAADVAAKAIEEGVARVTMTWDEAYAKAKADIAASRALTEDLMRLGHIKEPPASMLKEALDWAIAHCQD
jgi:hypothetical protein